jgi:hypothetical protein
MLDELQLTYTSYNGQNLNSPAVSVIRDSTVLRHFECDVYVNVLSFVYNVLLCAVYETRHVFLSVYSHGTGRLPSLVFSWNFIFENFTFRFWLQSHTSDKTLYMKTFAHLWHFAIAVPHNWVALCFLKRTRRGWRKSWPSKRNNLALSSKTFPVYYIWTFSKYRLWSIISV